MDQETTINYPNTKRQTQHKLTHVKLTVLLRLRLEQWLPKACESQGKRMPNEDKWEKRLPFCSEEGEYSEQ